MGVRVAALAFWLFTLASILPPDSFGWIASLLAIAAVCALIAPVGVPYLFFGAVHRDGGKEATKYWRDAVAALSLLGPALALLASWGFVLWIDSPIPLVWVVSFLMVEITLCSFVQTGALWMHAHGNFGSAVGLPALLMVSRAVAAILAMSFEQSSAMGYLGFHLIGTVAVAGLVAWRAEVIRRGLPRPGLPSWTTLSKSASYGLMGAGTIFSSELDKPLIARVLGLGVAGVYSIAYRLVATLATPATALAAAMLPRWSAMVERGDRAGLRQSFLFSCLGALMLGFLFLILVRAAADIDLGSQWGEYDDVLEWMDRLAWIVAGLGLHQIAGTALIAAGRPLLRAAVDLAIFFGLVGLMPLLNARYGLDGVASLLIAAEFAAGAIMACAFLFAPCRRRLACASGVQI